MLTNNSQDQSLTDIELARNAQIRKSRNDAISYGTTSIVLTILGFYLKSQSQFYNHQIMQLGFYLKSQSQFYNHQITQYCSSIVLALDVPFFIATTSSIFNYHSLKDFPDGSYLTLDKNKTPNLGENSDVKKFHEYSNKKAKKKIYQKLLYQQTHHHRQVEILLIVISIDLIREILITNICKNKF